MENQVLLTPLKRFFNLLKLDNRDIVYIYIHSILAGLIALSLPLGVQAIIGLIAGGSMSAALIILVLVVTLGTVFSGLIKLMQISITEKIQRRIFARSALDFSYRIPKFKMDFLSKLYPPELVNRFFDTINIQKGLPKILIDLTSATLQIAFGLILISFYHPFFAFFGLALLILLVTIFWLTGASGMRTSLMESKYKYKVAHWLEDMAQTIPAFKFFGKAPLGLKRADELVCSYLGHREKHFRVLVIQYSHLIALKTILTGSLLMLGSYLVIQNQINIGQFVAAEIVVLQVIASVEKLIVEMDTIYDVLTGVEKIGYVTDLPLEDEGGLPFEEIDEGKGLQIELRELSFQFNEADNLTINKLSTVIPSGQHIAIAGYNGSGKTTLLQLLMGYFTNFKGNILYNGIPLKNLDLLDLRQNIGHYSPETSIFQASIKENISLGRKDVGLKEVIKASKIVGLDRTINNMPKGYETELISEGRNISGNMRTKIMLARAIANNPRLLIIEGDLRSLERTEYEDILSYLTAKERPWTLVISTDDPFVTAQTDRTIILKDGKIVKDGSFQDILTCTHFRPIFLPNIPENILQLIPHNTNGNHGTTNGNGNSNGNGNDSAEQIEYPN
ncbi:MAG: ATP-binding cassette domain-containing protein [Bacteroidota bacterium]